MNKINIEDYIIFENNHYIVINKPEGVLSQGDETHDESMVDLLKEYLKEKYHKEGNVFLGTVHRLDRRVAGVMVYGKTSKASSRLSSSIRNNEFKKTYFAIVLGNVSGTKTLNNKIEKVSNNGYFAKISEEGKESILEFTSLKTFKMDNNEYSLLKINLMTGRFNQIRVQLSNIGLPIINDFKYGYKANQKNINKDYNDHLGLFCVKLEFPDPITKERKEYNINIDMLPYQEYINYKEFI